MIIFIKNSLISKKVPFRDPLFSGDTTVPLKIQIKKQDAARKTTMSYRKSEITSEFMSDGNFDYPVSPVTTLIKCKCRIAKFLTFRKTQRKIRTSGMTWLFYTPDKRAVRWVERSNSTN